MTGRNTCAGTTAISGSAVIGAGIVALFLLMAYGPLFVLATESLRQLAADPARALGAAILSDRRWGLLVRSVALSCTVAMTDLLLGILAGSFLWEWRSRLGKLVRWGIVLLVPLPLTVSMLAWTTLIQVVGLSSAAPTIGGWVLCWWIESMAFLPLAIGLTLVGFELLDPDLVHAARMLAPDPAVLKRVMLPLAAPFLLAGTGLLFVFCLVDFTIPSLCSLNVYSFEIFAEFSATNSPAETCLLALPLLLVTVPAIVVSQRLLRTAMQNGIWLRDGGRIAMHWPPWLWAAQRLAAGVVLLQTVAVIAALVYTVGSPDRVAQTVSSASTDIGTTVAICTAATILALPMALALAGRLVKPGPTTAAWWILVVLPLAIPPPLLGIGLIAFWNSAAFAGLYGTILMPVLAACTRFVPIAALLLAAQLRHVDDRLIDAARIVRTTPLRTLLSIRIPLALPGLLAAAVLVFSLAMGELGATLLVVPPGSSTLTIRLYNYLHYGSSETVAGLGLVMVGLFVLAAVCCGGLLWNRGRILRMLLAGDPR